jgi:hypothetical protein
LEQAPLPSREPDPGKAAWRRRIAHEIHAQRTDPTSSLLQAFHLIDLTFLGKQNGIGIAVTTAHFWALA